MGTAIAIENARGVPAHEPSFARELGGAPSEEQQLHVLDTPEALRVHGRLLDWYYDALDAQFENMQEQQLDYDFYDHIQWSEKDRAVLGARHQAALTYNKIKMALDWVIGTERRTRIDGVVHPRTEDDVDLAPVKGELLKYLSDTNRVPWERSAAFKDQAVVGLGWTEETVRGDRTEEPLVCSYVPWRQMVRDQFGRKNDLSDSRFVMRRKYLDEEYGVAMFPERAHLIRRAARDHLCAEDYGDGELDLPQVWRRYDSRGHEVSDRKIGGRVSLSSNRASRMRVMLVECWFRRPVPTKRIWGGGHAGTTFDASNPAHQALQAEISSAQPGTQPVYSLTDGVTEEIWCAIFTEEGLLQLQKSPFKHGQFPFTPYWCYRRDRDGMPYGLVRGVRDAQEDLNKRMSKLLWALSTNQFFYEENAIDPDRLEEIKQELAKPNGVIPLKDGAISQGRFKVERNLDVAEAQLRLLELDQAHIHDGSGVNREQLGRDTNATSGRAILAKQQEGAVTTAELFDNYRLGIQLSGEKQLALSEQFMTQERQFRIVGEKKGVDWRAINQLRYEAESNTWSVENDITKGHADFVVDQQDFRESMRQAYAEQFFEMLGKLGPDAAMNLLDLAVEMTDIPGKDEIVKRIRQINGQSDGDVESPEAQQRREQQERDAEIALRERLAKVGLDEAKAGELAAKTRSIGLKDKQLAMQIAQLLDVLVPLAPAADRLLSDETQPTQPTPEDAVYA
jgi:hypothetical protein